MSSITDKSDKEAIIAKMFEENYEKLSRYCYLYLKNPQDVEDIVSETFIKAYKNLDKFHGDNAIPWLCTIARNTIFVNFRKFEHKNVIRSTDYEDILEDETQNTESYAENNEQSKELYRLLNILENAQKEAITLRFIQEMEYAEIAAVMGKSENAIRLLVSKGLKKIKDNAGK